MKRKPFEDENIARCLGARREIEREHKDFAGLCEFLDKLEQEPFPTPAIRKLARPGGPRTVHARAVPFEEDEVMQRCHRVRQELFDRFKTTDEMHAWLMSLEEQQAAQRGSKRVKRATRSSAHQVTPRKVTQKINKRRVG